MQEILESLVGTWQGPIVVGWLVLMFIILFGMGNRFYPPAAVPASISGRFGAYTFFVILGSYYEVAHGFQVLEDLLFYYPDITFVGTAVFIVNIIYSVSFYYSAMLLGMSKPAGLNLARIFSLSFPIYNLVYSLLCFYFADKWTGKSICWDIYMHNDQVSMSIFLSLFFLPWFLYFSFSPELKRIWRKLKEGPAES